MMAHGAGPKGRVASVLIVTDAWLPQINGVVRTLEQTVAGLRARGIRVEIIHPGGFATLPCPTYPEIRLSLATRRRVGKLIDRAACDHIHIATEGPLGLLAAAAARQRLRRYSTSYHTRFPEFVAARAPVPIGMTYALLRRFHNGAAVCMVATHALLEELAAQGFRNLQVWPRGVDTNLFRPTQAGAVYAGLPRPVWLTVSRVTVEKSLPGFLDLPLAGTRVVVGDGPALPALRRRYPDVVFAGAQTGAELAMYYASADVFVFPSKTETLGLVLLEAMASGLPVAAFPARGPLELVEAGTTGVLSEDLEAAAHAALALSPDPCRAAAQRYSWEASTDAFLEIVAAVEAGLSP